MSAEVVCVGETITFTAGGVSDNGGVKRVFCTAKEDIPPVEVSYEWRITKPDGSTIPPLNDPPGTGPVATVVTDQPGNYSCTFTASADRDCPPDSIALGASKTVTTEVTLALFPSNIPATTLWPGMPIAINEATIHVVWDPPECEGTLEIVELTSSEGYVPPNDGTLERLSATEWIYTAFDEPQTELCPKLVNVWIAAMQGNEELARVSILAKPVHVHWTVGATANFPNAYNFIRWKYATVIATTGGTFTTVSISANACVPCGIGFPPPCVAACTHIDDSVDFGTSAFTQSENATASTIGHELVHTVGPTNQSECTAYTWEMNNAQGTGIFQCDIAYLQNVLQNQNCECNECP